MNWMSFFIFLVSVLTDIVFFISTPSPGIFPGTFLQLANSSKDSILNWLMKLNLFMFFFFFVFETPLKYFSFYSPIFLLFGLDTY